MKPKLGDSTFFILACLHCICVLDPHLCYAAHWSIGGTRKWDLLVFTVAQLIQLILKSVDAAILVICVRNPPMGIL